MVKLQLQLKNIYRSHSFHKDNMINSVEAQDHETSVILAVLSWSSLEGAHLNKEGLRGCHTLFVTNVQRSIIPDSIFSQTTPRYVIWSETTSLTHYVAR